MKTATTFSSGFVACLAAVSIACGGGGADDAAVDTDDGKATVANICEFASVEDMQRAIAAGVICRQYVVDSGRPA
jgi:hypothetical protein